ncbi:hypothetical protein TrCOL_g4449 [Triparma columacea]|uniref:Uncharacterized protein n=1 Tax=Triparma columacea TaxID=722753 RepID=A0A9W7L6N2_9STRA|nr:hypothetical protein TrCOL_g4449 [Triparma columacea]
MSQIRGTGLSRTMSGALHGGDSEDYPTNPFDGLAVKHGRAVQDCVELHLTDRGYTRIAGFERFVNLETLWLNDNNISKITNLDDNIRIKRLYLQNNTLDSLKGSLPSFTFLDTLIIYNNNLSDLITILEELQQMRHLEELDMHGNPLAEETNYRLLVIRYLPWLHVLDRHKITDEERLAAQKVRTAAEALDEDGTSPQKPIVKKKPTAKQVAAKSQLASAMAAIAEVVKTKRILLKDHFMFEDPRKEWVVTEAIFTKYMELYGLDLVAKLEEGEREFRGEFDSYKLILSKYAVKSGAPVRSRTMGRDTFAKEARHIDYVRFCMDVEPKFSSRDLDNMERLRAKARDLRLGPTLDDKVPLSQTVKNLRKSVADFKRSIEDNKKAERMAMIKMSEEAARKQRQMKVPMAKSEKDFVKPADELTAWEVNSLRTLVMSRPSYDAKAGTCGMEDFRKALEMMILCGKVAVTTDIDGFIEEERQARLALAEFEDKDPEDDEAGEVVVNPITRFLEEVCGGGPSAGLRDFLAAVVEGCGDVPKPTWRRVTHAEAINKSKELYSEAKILTQRVSLMGGQDEDMRKENTRRIKELGSWAVKLERIASGELENKFNKRLGPRKAVRGDTYVIKESFENRGVLDEDEGLSDDEEEERDADDTDDMWAAKVKQRRNTIMRTNELKKKFGLKEDVQSRYRVVLHTRRPKDFKRKGHILVTNKSEFQR